MGSVEKHRHSRDCSALMLTEPPLTKRELLGSLFTNDDWLDLGNNDQSLLAAHAHATLKK